MNHRGWWLLLTFSLAVAAAGWYSGARWTTRAARLGYEAGLATALTTVREQAALIDMIRGEHEAVTCVPDYWTGRCWWWDGQHREPHGWPAKETP